MSVSAPTPDVPSEWGIAKAEDVCEVQNGFAFKSVHFNDKGEGLPLIRIRDVHNGSSKTYYSGEYADKFVVSDGDLLVGMDGEFRVRRWGAGKGLLNQRVCRLQPVEGPMITDFLYYSIRRPLKQIEDFTPFTTVKHISARQIRAIELPLPPLPEQKKIVQILSTVQRAIEAQERIIQTTTELKKALMHKLFTEGLRNEPQKQTEIGPIPESWDVVELKSLLREPLRNGHSAKATTDPNGIRTLTLTAVTQRDFSVENTKVTCADPHRVRDMWLKSGDIFIERANTADYVGLAALYEGAEDFAIFPDLLIRVRVNTTRILPKVLIEWLLAEPCRRYYKKNARSTAGNFPKIDQGTVEKTLLPVPSTEEQTELESSFRTLDGKLQQHTERKAALLNLFRTLLHELMTAKTRVDSIAV